MAFARFDGDSIVEVTPEWFEEWWANAFVKALEKTIAKAEGK